ncbi:Vacuolar protein sorting-associated protein 20 [Linnemannia schmuckeri]|uniref:Vacuolar protein sorting-associated protein 20 n=1 Tax=Linnemannia schmuckeri TaxID=64567 RepID=A0A9P5S585_9FUNG|nr:Vacuolar protein sorting-associated protein 20 [Linnemannia schmuckeri]
MGSSSSKGAAKITAHDRAILDLKVQRDKLRQYNKRLEGVVEKELKLAKGHLAKGEKQRALLALRRKKFQESLLEKTVLQMTNLDELTMSIEQAMVEKQVFAGLAAGNQVLKELHKEMSLADVEKLMDETADSIAYQNEIDELLSTRLSVADEEDIERELDLMVEEETKALLPNTPVSSLPELEQQPVKEVIFFLTAFLLYIFISRRTTLPSQRLKQWLKAQSEADLLVETMASQGQCVVEGLYPCRRRDKMRKRQAAQRRRQHGLESSREDIDGGGGSGGNGKGGEHDEEMALDELWRRYQRQRPEDPATLVATSNDISANGTGNTGVSSSSETDPTIGTRIDREDMVAERLWEYVVGWCLIGCVFVGAGLIICANFMVHNDPTNTTPLTFDPEEGASLMDTIVANIIKVALGIQYFEDQLMEHGIFVFIVGVNGFVSVRQRVFGRRRGCEQELMRGGTMLPMETIKDVGRYDLEDKAVVGGEEQESEGNGEGFSEGKRDFYEDLHFHQAVTQGVERFTTTNQVSAQTGASAATVETRAGVGGGRPIEKTPSNSNSTSTSTSTNNSRPGTGTLPTTSAAAGGSRPKETSTHHSTKEPSSDEKKTAAATGTDNATNYDDNAPDFAKMSFLAWFNYLQIGILIIELLQLFSFPLRELMEFYNQAEKTSAMYEGAKSILDVFRTTATDSSANADVKLSSAAAAAGGGGGGGSEIHYKNGILSIGNSTLFDFNPRNSSTQDKRSFERPTFALKISEDDAVRAAGSAPTVLDQYGEDGMELLRKNASPQIQNATDGSITHRIGGRIQKLGASVDWIKENLHSWLPNIATPMNNNIMDGLESGRFEELRGSLVNAAVGVALQGFGGTNSSTASNATTLSAGGDPRTTKSSTDKIPSRNSNSGGDGDIVMQVVNSLGLQPSINTHDWYLLRFWSCFAAVIFGWLVALSIHAWNRRCRRLRREGRPHWSAISVGWVSCFIPVVSVLYLPILSTFLSSAACQSQAIHAYAHEKYAQQQEQARREGHGTKTQATGIFNSVILTLLDPASTVAAPSANSLLCTGPLVQPALYLTASLFAYTLAYVLFMVFLTSFERVPAKGEICFRPNGVAVLKNLGLLLAVDFLLIQSPAQRRFRGLVSIGIMLAMACYTIRMKPCYWNKINYWRTFSFSCVLYASLLVTLLCPSPPVFEKKSRSDNKAERERHQENVGRWVMAPHLKMGEGEEGTWMVMGGAGGGRKVMLAWIVAGWVLLVIVFVVVERVFLRHWTKKVAHPPPIPFVIRSQPPAGLFAEGCGYRGMDMFGGRGGVGSIGGELGAFAPATPGGGGGMYTNPGMSSSHWSVVDLSQTPETRRGKAPSSS